MLVRSLCALLLTCLSTLLLMVGVACYARYLEPRWVQETRWELTSAHWKGRPIRLAVVADLHAKKGDGAYLDSIVRRVLEAEPDVVLLLGDYISEPRLGDSMDAETLGHHLSPLTQLPCYAVLGNHDYDYGAAAIRGMLSSIGAEVLEGKVRPLEMGGDVLYLRGMRCLCHFDTPGRQEDLPQQEGTTCLLLTHSPAGAHYAPEGTLATLCGHTHGGQVCLPGGIPVLRPDRRVRWEEMRGEVWVKGKPVYVSRGLGTSMMPLRFFSRPELLMVELKSGS